MKPVLVAIAFCLWWGLHIVLSLCKHASKSTPILPGNGTNPDENSRDGGCHSPACCGVTGFEFQDDRQQYHTYREIRRKLENRTRHMK